MSTLSRIQKLGVAVPIALLCLAPPAFADETAEAPPGQEQPDASIEEAHALIDQDRFDEAEALARSMLERFEAEQGPGSIRVAEALDVLVIALWNLGKATDPETLSYAEQAVAIREKAVGPHDSSLTHSLNILAWLSYQHRNYTKAEQLYKRALDITQRTHGPEHRDMAKTLTNLGILYWRTGDNAKARAVNEQALPIFEQSDGPESPVVARCLENLGLAYIELGEYGLAREAHARALKINEKHGGASHSTVATSLHNLGVALKRGGDYREAETALRRAIEIREGLFGPDHPLLSGTLIVLANVVKHLGDYHGARSLYLRALDIQLHTVGPDDPDVGANLLSIGTLEHELGDNAAAIDRYREALEIYERAFGATHPQVAMSHYNIGTSLASDGQVEQARSHFERALTIRAQALGADHPGCAEVHMSLARLSEEAGNLDAALSQGQEAVGALRSSLGADHPQVAWAEHDLGRMMMRAGDYDRADAILRDAAATEKRVFGAEHPDLGAMLISRAYASAARGRIDTAIELALEGERIGREHTRLTIATLPEQSALRYAGVRSSGLDVLLSIVDRLNPSQLRSVFEALVRSRALVFDEMASRHRALWATSDAHGDLWRELQRARAVLAHLMVRGLEDEDPDVYRRLLAEAAERKLLLERKLAAQSADYRRAARIQQADLDEVTARIPPDAALVGFVQFEQHAFQKKGSGPRPSEAGLPAYSGFVFNGKERSLHAVRLGHAESIDKRVEAWRAAITSGVLGHEAEAEESYQEVARSLRESVWDPLLPHLGGVRRIFLVPDGALNYVNFYTLPFGEGEYLIEAGLEFHILSAERDLIQLSSPAVTGEGLLALGGPDYDTDLSASVADSGRPSNPADAGPVRRPTGMRSTCGGFESLRFNALIHTGREASEVLQIWREVASQNETHLLLEGASASETALKSRSRGRRYLHLATHAFFLGDRCPSLLDGVRGIGGLAGILDRDTRPARGENPLLLAGLALAGANKRSTTDIEGNDGILTAEEIAGLDLSGVEWTVLSACDTGVGAIRKGEGVLGLRRAFQVAGARTLITSLWSVDDAWTRAWMRELYGSRLGKNQSTVQSVRNAGLAILRERRATGHHGHPFYWGAFVAVGDWK